MAHNSGTISTNTVNVFDCKLVEYSTLWSNKIMWGMDCEIEPLLVEMYKLYGYSRVSNSLETSNDCEAKIPAKLKQKIDKYSKALTRTKSQFCRNC